MVSIATCFLSLFLFPISDNTSSRLAGETIAPESPSERPKFALLIGINRYNRGDLIPDVPGGENDAKLIREVLVDSFGFRNDPSNLRMLLTRQATRENIIDEFRSFLIAQAKANQSQRPIIAFYFSGHGTQYPNQQNDIDDPDAIDGMDEAIVPVNSRENGVFDILDDELDDLTAELAQYSSDILMIFDSCNSGTVTRGETSKEISPDPKGTTRTPYVRKYPPAVAEASRRDKVVAISAALPYESAYPRVDGSNGLMTWHLAAALRRATKATTYQSLIRDVRSGVLSEGTRQQHPVTEGDDLRPVLGEGAQRTEPSFSIVSVENDKVKFQAGKVHGVREGSLVAIYEENATSLSGSRGFITYATVDAISDRESLAILPAPSENARSRLVTSKSKLVLAAPSFGKNPITLVLDDASLSNSARSRGNELTTEIRQLLQSPENPLVRNGLVELANEGVRERNNTKSWGENYTSVKRGLFRDVFPDSSKAHLSGNCTSDGKAVPGSMTEVYYLQAESKGLGGKPVPLFGRYFSVQDPRTSADEIVKTLIAYSRRRNLLLLENSNSSLNNRIEVGLSPFPQLLRTTCLPGAQKIARVGWHCSDKRPPIIRNNQIPQDMVFQVKVRNTTSDPLAKRIWVAAFMVTGDGRIILLNGKQGTPIIDKEFGNGQELSFMMIANPPAQADSIKVVITTNFDDLEGLRFLENSEWQNVKARGTETPLAKLLGDSGVRSRAGGSELAPADPDSWGVATFDWSVAETKFDCNCGQKMQIIDGRTVLSACDRN